jgi:ERCC4-type nuclease
MSTKTADSAEPSIITKKLIVAGWVRERMPSGDYCFYTQDWQRVGITRKTISDLLSSINDKFGEQLAEMKRHFDIRIILLEGNWRTILPQRKLLTTRRVEHYTWNTIWNFLRTWQDRGFTLELTMNQAHTVQRLEQLYNYYQKPLHTGGIHANTKLAKDITNKLYQTTKAIIHNRREFSNG